MAEKANRRSENLSDVKTRFMKHLAVCCVEVDRLIRTRRRAFHQGQGHRDPRQKVGYMAAACPFRIDNCSCKPGRVIYGGTGVFRGHTGNYVPIQRVPETRDWPATRVVALWPSAQCDVLRDDTVLVPALHVDHCRASSSSGGSLECVVIQKLASNRKPWAVTLVVFGAERCAAASRKAK